MSTRCGSSSCRWHRTETNERGSFVALGEDGVLHFSHSLTDVTKPDTALIIQTVLCQARLMTSQALLNENDLTLHFNSSTVIVLSILCYFTCNNFLYST